MNRTNTARHLPRLLSLAILFGASDASAATGLGYLFADRPSTSSYQPDRARSFSSAYQRPEVTRSGTGSYWVRFPGLGGGAIAGGNVQVTASASDDRHCKVTSWSSGGTDFIAGIRCFLGAAAADARFTAMVTWPGDDAGAGFAWANSPSSKSYAPSATYAHNGVGGGISITRSSTGRYAVRFDGLGGSGVYGGNVQVTAYGGGSERCQVTGWSSGGSDLVANVACFTAQGAPADTYYSIFVRGPADPSARFSHLWADQPSRAAYTPSPTYARSAAGEPISIVRSSAGVYRVTFAGLSDPIRPNEHVEVTAYGSVFASCIPSSWSSQSTDLTVVVRCFGANGPADQRFSLLVAGRNHYPGEPQMDAIAKLEHDSDRRPRLRLEEGRVRFAAMAITPASGQDPVARALSFLEEYRELYGIDAPSSELFLSRIYSDELGQHLFFGMRRDGLPIYGAELAVHLDPIRVTSTNGSYATGAEADPEPEVSLEAAEQIAVAGNELVLGRAVTPPRLWYFAEDGELSPAWRVPVRGLSASDGDPETVVYLIHGRTGEVLSLLSNRRAHAAVKDFELWTAAHGERDRDTCRFNTSPALWFDEAGPTAAYTPTDVDADRTIVAFHDTYDAYYLRFHRHGPDDADGLIKGYVHYSSSFRNAFYDASCGFMVIGDGMAANDVVAHELTHIVADPFLAYQNESGALNESYADIFATMVDPDWALGEDTVTGAIRDLSDPTLYGDPDNVWDAVPLATRPSPANDFGGVHSNSGIHNKVAYLLIDGGTHQGVTVAPIHRNKTYQLFHATLPTLTLFSTFLEAREATVETAGSFVRLGRHGFTIADVCSVLNAFAAVGIGDHCDAEEPPGEGDHIPPAFDNCPAVRNPDQRDRDEDGVGDACDVDDDDDGVCDVGGPVPGGTDGAPAGGCVAGPSGVDNCQTIPNASQSDDDGDGDGEHCDDDDGDGIFNARDNCISVPNRRQENLDGDGLGDVCDGDDDGDGVSDGADNCARGDGDEAFEPAVDQSASQADGDGDGIGNLCDTCPTDPDPTGADTDGDRIGDVCDLDDDDDGVSDGPDNCPLLDNPHQIDIDGNGVGLLCDEGEAFMLSAEASSQLSGVVAMMERLIRIPIVPCIADGCPVWLPEGFRTVVDVVLPQGFEARLVDSIGRRVGAGSSSPNGTTLTFHPKADAHYVFASQKERISVSRYFLEIVAPDGFQLGSSIPVVIGAHNEP